MAGRETVDAYGTWWFQWWVAEAVSRGDSLARSDALFHPWGKDILTHTGGNLLDALLLIPLRILGGPAFAWNGLAATALFTNGLAAGIWAARSSVPAGRAAGLLAVAFAVFNPFALHEIAMGRPTQAILAPLILALALGDASFRGRLRWRDAVLAGALLALQGWFYWYAAGFGALALGVLAVGRPFGARLARLAAAGSVSLLLTAPVVLPLLAAVRTGEAPGLLPVDAWIASGPVFQNAEGGTIQLGTLGAWGVAGFLTDARWVPEGITLGVLGIAAALGAPRRWIAVAAVGLVVAVGPFPAGLANYAYLGLAKAFPPMERLYWPVRSVAILVPAGVMGIVWLMARVPEAWRVRVAMAMTLALGAEAFGRGALPLGTWTPAVPRAAECLRAAARSGGEGGAVITLPYGLDQQPLVLQTTHGRPMLNGMNERSPSLVPLEQRTLRLENTWIRAVLAAPEDPRAEPAWTEADREAVRALGYRWILLRADGMEETGGRIDPKGRRRAAIRRLTSLAGEPVYTGEDATIYAPWGGWPGCD